MDKSIRAIFWILVALVILSSFSTVWFFIGKEDLYKEYIKLQETLKTTIARFTEEVNSLNNERLKIQEKLEAVYSQLRSIEKERNELKADHMEVLGQNDSLKKELARLSKESTGLKHRIKELEGEEFLVKLLRENATLEVRVQSLMAQLEPKEAEIKKISDGKLVLEQGLKNIEIEKRLLEERLKESNSIVEVLTRDLANEKNQLMQFEQTQLENSILKSQIADTDRLRAQLQKNLADLNVDYVRAQRQAEDAKLKISSLEETISKKEEEIERIRLVYRESQPIRAEAYKSPEGRISGSTKSVELPPIVITPERTEVAKATAPSIFENKKLASNNIKGKVITVNREHNFAVIDLGERDGIRVGTRLSVYRGNMQLGILEVIQTRERIAAADIKELDSDFQIMVDDIVVMQ